MKKYLVNGFLIFIIIVLGNAKSIQAQQTEIKVFQAGASKSVITPPIGTSINGQMRDRTVRNIHDETHARAIVLDDGKNQLAIVVADLCMVYRETLDKAKQRAHEYTSIPKANMMMSATHTHSAGAACSVFQSDPDPAYLDFLSERIADAVIRAYENRVPADIGWGFGHESSQVFNRRWKLKPSAKAINPFGGEDLVKMNPGVDNPNKLEPAGPIDPEVAVVSIVSKTGNPIALLANYSLHYVGGTGANEISADYFGMFANRIEELVGTNIDGAAFVGIMSNGTSGDINNIDFSGKTKGAEGAYVQMQYVASVLAREVHKVYQNIEYRDGVGLQTAQEEIELDVRLPKEKDIHRAEQILKNLKEGKSKSMEEIYARETILLKNYPKKVTLLLQTFRIGDLAIAAIPCEVFVEIGLGLKKKNFFEAMFTVSLANGYNGYLPTAEHHALGGYETWRARSSYLEVQASEKISNMVLELLKQLNR